MSEWQPIKTAPKDNRSILTWDGADMVVCFWCRCSEQWAPVNNQCSSWEGVTHWMPLPEPPA